MRRIMQHLTPRKWLAVLLVATLGFVVGAGLQPQKAFAADCDANAIIKCGFSSKQDFINKVRANSSGNGYRDLIDVYNAYGFDTAKYNDFVRSAKAGTAYKNGNIVVNGRVVATDSNSIGRLRSFQGDSPFSKRISGQTYYGNSNNRAFKTDGLPVTVLFNDKGVAIFAVLNACGNPMGFTPTKPTYTCTNLSSSEVSGQPGTFKFRTKASAGNGATIKKLVYDFGDGTTKTSYNVNEVVQHTYKSSKTFRATVKVYVSLPFGNGDIVGGAGTDCATLVAVHLPEYKCLSLQAVPIPNKQYTYQIIVKTYTKYGASLSSGSLNYGDGTSDKNIARANADTISKTHTFKAGQWKVMASVTFNLPDGKKTTVTSASCATTIKIAEYGCAQLTGALIDAETNKLAYRFSVAANATKNLVTLKGVDFDFGDGATAKNVQAKDLLATADHTYAADGNYTITAILHFNVKGKLVEDSCSTTITKSEVDECKPGVPADSELCKPCEQNPDLPKDSPDCAPPPPAELPNTGAGQVIAITGVAAVIGFFLYRQFIFRRHVFHTGNDTVNMLLGEPAHHRAVKHEMAHHNAHHRNKQGLHGSNYRRPHRFRPRSHK